jgi:hypothetical protein
MKKENGTHMRKERLCVSSYAVRVPYSESELSAFCSSNGFFYIFSSFPLFFIIRNLRYPSFSSFSRLVKPFSPLSRPFFIWLRIEGCACLGCADQRAASQRNDWTETPGLGHQFISETCLSLMHAYCLLYDHLLHSLLYYESLH